MTATARPRTHLICANAYACSALVGALGDALGTVVDFVLDTSTGTIAYVVVAKGGFMGMGEERYALPWAYVTPLQGAGETQWRCATAQLPLHFRWDGATALPPAYPP